MSTILLFNASNSSRSIHQNLLNAIAPLLSTHKLCYASSLDFDLPFYSEDAENEQGYPQAAKDFVALLHKHDAVILACPEHNGAPPAIFKNLYDWGTRAAKAEEASLFNQRKLLILTTSGGERGGLSVQTYLKNITPFHGATVVGAYSIGKYYDNFVDGQPTPAANQILQAAADDLQQALA
ncbi:NADPH-dependent FMN reductase [Pasteurella multocida]|uniref:NADPH-dependent FMN reductase n=1 Tax=Pasteurella multocida TaxID=747 RepID=UPI00287AEF6F|nr:NAD(P)H-dependent oxidoreductase [Pasteurella multocida]HDX1193345.1 NAD(P)H-dependent oxidoreductase [Pasteurella multocida]HDX1193751.1 NAD(P)H-dependent oxidoreductase [Pasteurella multocida]